MVKERPDAASPKKQLPKRAKPEYENAPRFSQQLIRNIMLKANPEMNLAAGVPAMVNSAAVQFSTYLAQTALENSLINKRSKEPFSMDYIDVATAIHGDPRLEVMHESVPYQITVDEALKKRHKLLKKIVLSDSQNVQN